MASMGFATARIARAVKEKNPQAEVSARRELAVLVIEDFVTKTLHKAPALTVEQRSRLVGVLETLGGDNHAPTG